MNIRIDADGCVVLSDYDVRRVARAVSEREAVAHSQVAVDQIIELRAALREALDRWEGWDVGKASGAHANRIAELRKLLE